MFTTSKLPFARIARKSLSQPRKTAPSPTTVSFLPKHLFSSVGTFVDPTIDTESLRTTLLKNAPEIAHHLTKNGYYTTTNLLPPTTISTMRTQASNLRHNDQRFVQSYSEKIEGSGTAVRFDKPGVFACEPDGGDYDTAPDLLVYMSILLGTLPEALSGSGLPTTGMELSSGLFNAKLAVTSPGGSVYPLHIDNPQGLSVGDTRKLTCILYLNPEYRVEDGGELRMFLGEEDGDVVDLSPVGGRLLMFWSDEIPHEVRPTAPLGDRNDKRLDRYALTIWIPTDNVSAIHNEASKFSHLRDMVFTGAS